MTQTTTTNALLARRAADTLGRAPGGLITDVDGTISPIVPRPEQARVLPLAKRALRRLRERVAVVAVLSGRGAADARRLVGVAGIVYVGNHGLEVMVGKRAEVIPEARVWVPRVSEAVKAIEERLGGREGVVIEDKGASASLHYRLAPDHAATRAELLGVVRESAAELRVEEGRQVINLLPPLAVNKGTAVRWLVEQQRLRGVVCLGDDVTDAHAFEALAGAGSDALRVAVVARETPSVVRASADAEVGSPLAAAQLLSEVADLLGGAGVGSMQAEADRRRRPNNDGQQQHPEERPRAPGGA